MIDEMISDVDSHFADKIASEQGMQSKVLFSSD
jgi:hypothetical protein